MRNPTMVSHALVTSNTTSQPRSGPVMKIMDTVKANGKFTRWEPFASRPSQTRRSCPLEQGAGVALRFGWTSVGGDATGMRGSVGIGPSRTGTHAVEGFLLSRFDKPRCSWRAFLFVDTPMAHRNRSVDCGGELREVRRMWRCEFGGSSSLRFREPDEKLQPAQDRQRFQVGEQARCSHQTAHLRPTKEDATRPPRHRPAE